MIDWEQTEVEFGINSLDGYRPRVAVTCDKCGKESQVTIYVKSKVIDSQMPWECPRCVALRPEVNIKLSKSTTAMWTGSEYRQARSESSKELWTDGGYKDRHSIAVKCPESRKKCSDGTSKALRQRWQEPQYRQVMDEVFRKRWADDNVRSKIAQANQRMPKVSQPQQLLYSMLDDIGVRYYREWSSKPDDPQVLIGPWSFDCAVPRTDNRTLLIECNGDYWHGLKKSIERDKRKASYVVNNLSDSYELKYLWEHEFVNYKRVYDTLRYWLGLTQISQISFDFDKVSIRSCRAEEYKLFLGKYHYLSNAGRGGITQGAYLDDELIAVCIFSPLVRQNITVKEYTKNEIRELSRLCAHPEYRQKNFLSWFISKCINRLSLEYKCIISYADTTFNHHGTVYKASNFHCDKEVKPDYHYRAADGWVMHKKTCYNHAKKMKMSEREFAESRGYMKIWGSKKLRFIYERSS